MDPIRIPDCCPHSRLRTTVVGQDPTTVTLAVHGEIDVDNAEHLTHVLSAPWGAAIQHLILDMNGIGFLGSSGIAALLEAHTRAEAAGRRLVLHRPSPMAYRVLEITGLVDMFGLSAPDVATSASPPTDLMSRRSS